MMNIWFRVDASYTIGTGHVMRCLTLAEMLSDHGANIRFICRSLSGNLMEYIREKGYQTYALSHSKNTNVEDITPHSSWLETSWKLDAEQTINVINRSGEIVDWLVLDHYALDESWEKTVSAYVKKIMVIDDLADRNHYCDLLLDQNYFFNLERRYDRLLSNPNCKVFLGPQYALLRSEFRKVKPLVKVRKGPIKNILVFFGGSDSTGETLKTLDAIQKLDTINFRVDVVVGAANPNKLTIKKICDEYDYLRYHHQIDYMAKLMINSDLAIGAGGSTSWERCYLGLPALVISVAENQRLIAETLGKLGVIQYVGSSDNVREHDIQSKIVDVILGKININDMSLRALSLMDNHDVNIKVILDNILRS